MKTYMALSKSGKRSPLQKDENFHAARTRKEKALADLRQLEAAEKRGQLVDAEAYNRLHGEHILAAKARLRAIPSKCAQEVAALKLSKKGRELTAAVQKLLLREIDAALEELSKWKPKGKTTTKSKTKKGES